jgi:hypothetical protein
MSLRAAVRVILIRACAGAILLALIAPAASRAAGPEQQIRDRIDSIRRAIIARQAVGIVRWGTDDWLFTGPDGVSVDKTTYLTRARALMDRIVTVDALETTVDRVDVRGDTADVEITQAMERHERDAANGTIVHLKLRYRERHEWIRASDGWRVRRVSFIGAPERTVVSQTPARK